MNVSTRWLVLAGALVVALTNAVVLVGAAANRRQPADAVFALSERELAPTWSDAWRERENSGLGLRLQYRVESVRESGPAAADDEGSVYSFGGYGSAAWLDRDKLEALGIHVIAPPADIEGARSSPRMPGREVFLVLEMDGPVRARALAAAQNLLAQREQEVAGGPGHEDHAQRVDGAREALQREETQASRLFVVDAGLDPAALRQHYPDRARYAIVRGSVHPSVTYEGKIARVSGNVTAVRCDSINVPLQFQSEVVPRRYTIRLAFGRRFEPWIMAASAAARAPERVALPMSQ